LGFSPHYLGIWLAQNAGWMHLKRKCVRMENSSWWVAEMLEWQDKDVEWSMEQHSTCNERKKIRIQRFRNLYGNWEADLWLTCKTVTCSEMVYEDGSRTQDGFSDS